jgi:hypothetical protein
MTSGDSVAQSARFRDYKATCEHAEIIMLDSQARGTGGFRVASKPETEVRMWAVGGSRERSSPGDTPSARYTRIA